MVTSLAHACFVVADLKRAERFYRDQRGLRHASACRNDQGRRFGVYRHAGGRAEPRAAEPRRSPRLTARPRRPRC